VAEVNVNIKGTLTHADGTAEEVTIQGIALTDTQGVNPVNEGDKVQITGSVTIAGAVQNGEVAGVIRKEDPSKGPKTK
jgi:hypothetical protein